MDAVKEYMVGQLNLLLFTEKRIGMFNKTTIGQEVKMKTYEEIQNAILEATKESYFQPWKGRTFKD